MKTWILTAALLTTGLAGAQEANAAPDAVTITSPELFAYTAPTAEATSYSEMTFLAQAAPVTEPTAAATVTQKPPAPPAAAVDVKPAAARPAPAPVPPGAVTLTDVPAGHWARTAIELLIKRGLLLGYPDGTYRGSAAISRYEAATIFARLLDTGVLDNARLGQADMTTIARGVAEVADEVIRISNRVGMLEARDVTREARLSRMEAQVTQMAALLASALPETSNAAARLGAVEQAVTALPGVLVGKAAVADLSAVRSQNDALTAQLADLSSRQAALDARLTASEAAQTAKAALPVAFPEPKPTPVPEKRLHAGVSGTGTVTDSGLRYGAAVEFGVDRLLGPVGASVSAFSRPSAQAYGIDLSLTATFDTGGLKPYVGIGGGVVFSPSRADVSMRATDPYVVATVGVDYPVSDNLALFAEGRGRYFTQNAGYATGLNGAVASGIGLGFAAGVRFSF